MNTGDQSEASIQELADDIFLLAFFTFFLFSFLLWIFVVVAVVVFCFFVLSLCFGFSKKRFRCGGMDHPRCFRKLRVFWDGWIVCHCRSIVIVQVEHLHQSIQPKNQKVISILLLNIIPLPSIFCVIIL